MVEKSVVLLSGGLDSAVCLYDEARKREVIPMFFDMGQESYDREVNAAQRLVEDLRKINRSVRDLIQIVGFNAMYMSSRLSLSSDKTPLGEGVSPDFVPGRNSYMVSVAYQFACMAGASCVVIGCTATDALRFPDCTPEWINATNFMFQENNRALLGVGPLLVAPLLLCDRGQVRMRASTLGVPVHATWSCYRGGDEPCGECESCKQ